MRQVEIRIIEEKNVASNIVWFFFRPYYFLFFGSNVRKIVTRLGIVCS